MFAGVARGGGFASVDHAHDDLATEKNAKHVREVRNYEGEREGPKRGGAAHRGGRILEFNGGGNAGSGEAIRRPGGDLGLGFWGKERGRGGDYIGVLARAKS